MPKEIASAVTPTLGPLQLACDTEMILPPLAVIFDEEPLHCSMVSRLSSSGFPLAWYSINSNGGMTSNLRGVRARTPRHAAEIAAHLPCCTSSSPGTKSTKSMSKDVYDRVFKTQVADKFLTRVNPVLLLVAVAGDFMIDIAIERLLTGERGASSVYLDHNLLAGSVLVLIGPMSEATASSALRRCKRYGVALVVAATEGNDINAEEGTLHFWCAAETEMSVRGAWSLFSTLASTVFIVGTDQRDACCARLARALAGTLHDFDFSVLQTSGASFAMIAAERRLSVLEVLLGKLRASAAQENLNSSDKQPLDSAVVNGTEAMLENKSNHTLRVELDTLWQEFEDQLFASGTLRKKLSQAAHCIQDAKVIKKILEKVVGANHGKQVVHANMNNLLTELQAVLFTERQIRQQLQRRFNSAEQVASVHHSQLKAHVANLEHRCSLLENEQTLKSNSAACIREMHDGEFTGEDDLKVVCAKFETLRRNFALERSSYILAIKAAENAERIALVRAEKAKSAASMSASFEERALTELENTEHTFRYATSERDLSVARACKDVESAVTARIDAEKRSRRTLELLLESSNRLIVESNLVKLSSGITAANLKSSLTKVFAAHFTLLEERFHASEWNNASLLEQNRRMQHFLADAQVSHKTVLAVATSRADMAIRQALVDLEYSNRMQSEWETAGQSAALEIEYMTEDLQMIGLSGELVRNRLHAERTAGVAAQATLVEVGMETARLASEIIAVQDARVINFSGAESLRRIEAKKEITRLKTILSTADNCTTRTLGNF